MGSVALMTNILSYILYSVEKYTIIVGCPPHQEGARTYVAVVINCVRCCVTNISAPSQGRREARGDMVLLREAPFRRRRSPRPLIMIKNGGCGEVLTSNKEL